MKFVKKFAAFALVTIMLLACAVLLNSCDNGAVPPVTDPPATDPVSEVTEPTVADTTVPITDPVTAPVTEPVTEPITEPVTEPVTTEAPATEPVITYVNPMTGLPTEEDLSDVTDELVDRFGEPPAATQNLLRVALIHSTAVKCRITSIRQMGTEIHIYPQRLDIDIWSELADLFPGRLRILMSGEPHLCLRPQKGDVPLTLIHKIFEKYIEINHQKG